MHNSIPITIFHVSLKAQFLNLPQTISEYSIKEHTSKAQGVQIAPSRLRHTPWELDRVQYVD